MDPHGIMMVREKPPGGYGNGTSALNFLDWKNQNNVFEHMAAVNYGGSVTLTGVGRPEELPGVRVSASYFEIFGIQAVLAGRLLRNEDQLGKNLVVVLSHRLWENRIGADPSIIGRRVDLNGKPFTIIGNFGRRWRSSHATKDASSTYLDGLSFLGPARKTA